MILDFKSLKKLLKTDSSRLPELNVAIVGDTATQFLVTSLKGMAIDRGFRLNLFEADYNQVEQQFFDSQSELNLFQAQYIIVFQSTHKWAEKHARLKYDEQCRLADERLSFIKGICSLTEAKIIYLNLPEIEDTVFGSYANRIPSSFTWQVRRLNSGLMELSRDIPHLFICDIAGLQNKFGRDWMFDPTIYTSTEMVLSIDALPYVASRIMDIICAIEGKFKKCLILDLDNTLWGGIVGDDGWEKLQLGHGLGIGKAFTEFQLWIKKLKERGIIICICSKNDENKAKEPFEKHPEMILRLDDISVFMANWETKVDNILAIKHILNIGLDSMVFIDDNPFERSIVKEHLPEVTVPDLPEDPAEYLEYLYSLNLFETASFSHNDADRTKQYQIQAQRDNYARSFTDEKAFLKSLGMTSLIEGFTPYNTPRVAQLSQRSNQFNLRTIRYTEQEIEKMSSDPDIIPLTFTLTDTFGDNGLICVVILKRMDSETAFIDTWFMSCRVLKRGMEDFVLNTIVEAAKEAGYKYVVGEFIPTAKNQMVKDHYPNLGFVPDGTNFRYRLALATYQKRLCYIKKQ